MLALLAAAVWFVAAPPAPVLAQDFDNLPAPRIEQLPTWHGGSLFTFELHFAEDTSLSFLDVRDDMFEVDGGRVTRAPRITQGSNQSWLVHVRPDGFGDITIAGLGMTATVPGPGDRLVARISELPVKHDGEEEFTARLDFNRSPDLKPRDVRGPVVVVTGGDVRRSPRVVKGSNFAWTLMITPDGSGTVGIAVPITGSCGSQGDVCLDDGTQLVDGAWRTVRGPDRNTLTRPQNTIGNTETQPTIRQDEPALTEPPDGPTGVSHQAAKTECAYSPAPTATSFTYNLLCDSQLAQFTAYLTHPSKTHSYTERQIAYRTEGSGPANWTTVSGTNPASVSLAFSGTGIKYEVCIFPGGGSGTVTANDHFCDNDSSGHSTGTRGETRVIALSLPLTLSSPGDMAFIQHFDIKPVQFPAAQGGIGGYTYAVTDTPAGMSFNPANRTLSGTPNTLGDTFIGYTATDEDGSGSSSPQANFTITVESRVLPSPGNQSFKKDVTITPVTFPEVTGAGGASLADHNVNLTYALSPNPPTGLQFNAATRTLSGKPTAVHDASTNFSYTVSNQHGLTLETVTFTITVVETIDVPTPNDVKAYVGVPFSVTLPAVTDPTATGTIRYNVMGAPYNWGADWPDGPERSPGLPAGVTFNRSTRVLSGTPQHTVGVRRLAYGAVDANGAQGEAEFDLRIREPLTLAQPDDITVADGEAMVPVNLPRAQDGHSTYPDGYTFYDYSVSNLPFGLRYERFQHQIYGTPRYSRPPREVEVTLSATDTAGTTVRRAFTIEMLACAVTVDPIDDRTYHAGTAIAPVVLPVARGACGDVSYELNGLPAGLEFDAETRTLSGTPDDFDGNEENYLYQVQYVASDEQGSKTVEFTIVVPNVASVCGPNRDAARDWNGDYRTNLDLPDTENEAWFKTATPNGRFTLPAATGGQPPYTYAVRGLPDGVCFDPESRAVFGTPPITRYPTVHWYYPYYFVQDASGDSRESYFKINVYD